MSTRLPDAAYADALERTAARVAELTARLDPDAGVPSCPQWTVRDVVAHLGGVHGWARGIIAGGSPKDPRPEPDGELAQWYAGQAGALLEALRGADPDAPAWSFSGERTVAFWIRRQPHEAAMHLVDLQLAAGEAPAYEPALAADAVTETFDVMLPRLHADEPIAVSAPLLLVASDTGDRWLLRPSEAPGSVDYTHSTVDGAEPEEAAVTASAPAGDLATGLWGRTPYALWGIEGDRDVLDQLLRSGVTP